jgi:hypothetical protein
MTSVNGSVAYLLPLLCPGRSLCGHYAVAGLPHQQSAATDTCDTSRVTDDHSDPTEAAYVQQINAFAERILTADDPYDVGLELMGALADLFTDYYAAARMYWTWGKLTDWVDFQEPNEPIARAEMVRAAREWLALDTSDNAAVNTYLDHWAYDVCGAERPPQCTGGSTSSV